eukprot:6492661-Amphidinium_carterae.1
MFLVSGSWFSGASARKDSSMGKRVQEAIHHDSYWGWLRIVDAAASFCHVHRQWCLACDCHEVECQAYAAKSKVYPCPMKSMRGPRLHSHLEMAKHALREQMQTLASSPEFDGRADMRTCLRDAADTLVSSVALKFSFTSAMPWLVWRLRAEPELSTQILAEFDLATEQGRVCNRLHTKFCVPPLRKHLEVTRERYKVFAFTFSSVVEALSRGEPLSNELDAALLPYEVARLDGAAAEGIHRNVQLTIDRASASRFCYWSAHLRLKQNIGVWESIKANGDQVAIQRFLSFFAQPSRLQAKVWTFPALPRPAKVKRQLLLARHYRLWPHNMVDFAWLLPKKEVSSSLRSLLSDVTYCHYELFKWLFQVGNVFSYVSAADVSVSEGAYLLAHTQVFEVVMGDVSMKKVQHSVSSGMLLPIYIQRYVVQVDRSELGTSLCVRRDSEVELVDGVSLIEPNAVLRRLYKWEDRAKHVDGTELDMFTRPVQVSQDVPAANKPIFFIVLELRKVQKWASSDESHDVHTADTPKVFNSTGFSKRRWYLTCLLSLPSILERLGSLRADQHERYYECVCAGLDPPLNLRVKDYVKLLSGEGVVSQPVLAESTDLSGNWEEAFFGEETCAEGVPEEEADDVAVVEHTESSAGGSADVALVPDLPASIDGIPLYEDNHAGYRRLLIVCPLTHGMHKAGHQCRKYRNIGLAQMSTLGNPNEVAAYLGAWARLAPACKDRNAHVARNPTREDMLAVAREKGWVT